MKLRSFDFALNQKQQEDIIVSRWGVGSEFEAVSRIQWDSETGDWYGFLVFKDDRFSPLQDDHIGLQFLYTVPSAGNGVLAEQRAENTWETLVGIFQSLIFSNALRKSF